MFTGIISDIGRIERVEHAGDAAHDLRIVVGAAYDMTTVDLGASIACSGVCLTVVEKGPHWFAADVSGETVSRTAADGWTPGRRLNLERALKLGEELGGHIVTGHVDGIGHVIAVSPDGDSRRITIAVPPELAPFVAPKGSVTVDGVSLTVNAVEDHGSDHGDVTHFSVNIISHTQAMTTLDDLQAGREVHIEIDVLARYLKRMEHYRGTA